jgi:hypothetical protein
MSEERDEKLDALLKARKIEPASPDLAERIILKARSLPQHRTLSLWQAILQICAEFHLPKPAYVVAGALIVGMVLGYSAPPKGGGDNDDDVATIQKILSADEALL